MTLAQTWMRQALGAAGASLLAPLAIAVALGVLVAGGGLGGLSELGQLTTGPTLPGSGLGTGGSQLADADIVGADASIASATPASPSGGLLAAAPTGTPDVAAPLGGDQLQSPLLNVPGSRPGGGGGAGGVTPQPLQTPAPPPPPGSVGQVVGGTRELQMVVPEQIQPVTQNLINLLTTPPD